jgi:hypothetical protein
MGIIPCARDNRAMQANIGKEDLDGLAQWLSRPKWFPSLPKP